MSSTLEIVSTPHCETGSPIVALLQAGIPLSLLMDIARDDPHSQEMYDAECAS